MRLGAVGERKPHQVVFVWWWQVRDATLDLAYIDSRLDYDRASEDLAAWWPKICVRHLLLRAAPDATLVVTSDHPASWLFCVFSRPPRPC